MSDREDAEREAQDLLAQAQRLVDRATDLAMKHNLDGLSFMRQTFHTVIERWGKNYKLVYPDWFDNEYWTSSTAHCDVEAVYEDDD